jgi:hypothetical protein
LAGGDEDVIAAESFLFDGEAVGGGAYAVGAVGAGAGLRPCAVVGDGALAGADGIVGEVVDGFGAVAIAAAQ